MRWAIAVVTLCGLARPSAAGEANGAMETLVAWSDDGQRFAVTGFRTDRGEFFLEVRDGTKVLGHWKEGDKGVPAGVDNTMGPDRIDVATWEPTKKLGLVKLEAAARTRFAAALVLTSSTTQAGDRYHCKRGGWSLKRKSGGKAIREVAAGKSHCFNVLGGYLDKAGTHALVKIQETWQDPTPGEKITTDITAFELIEIPK